MPHARFPSPLALALLVTLVATGARAESTLPDQVVVLRAPRATRLEVSHVVGDRVAVLEIENPPSNAAQVLSGQVGPFVGKIEHILRERTSLRLLVRLTTDAVEIATRRLRSPSGWAIEYAPLENPPFPTPAQVIGHLPGLVPPPARPVLFPLEPTDTPCTGNPDARALEGIAPPSTEPELERRVGLLTDPFCRDWAISRLAARTLEQGRDPEAYERWAFLFAIRDRAWPVHPEALAQASLVAAEVLARTDYVPEAEVLLADRSRYRRRHAPFRAMALANLFAIRGEHDEAETLYRELIANGFDPWTIHRASLARALNALEGGDTLGALKYAERAATLLEKPANLPGDLWLVGGEAALALGELALAHRHYDFAARSKTDIARGVGLLRLADLEIRAGRRKSAVKGWALAVAAGFPCASDHAHLRRVLTLETDHREVEAFLASTARFSRCEPVRMEAKFALAQVHILRGEEDRALTPAVEVVREGISRWGPARAHRALVTKVAASAAARRMRHRDPAGLVSFFEGPLGRYTHLLDTETRLAVGRAYAAIGAAQRGAEELVALVTDHPEHPEREEILLTLGEALLSAKDTFRTDLVLRHLEARYPNSRQQARREALAGRYELEKGRYAEAISHLEEARRQYPSGDRRDALALPRTRALLGLGRVVAAANTFPSALDAHTLPDSALLATAVELLSECVRACPKSTLARVTAPTVARLGRDVFSPRLVSRLARRGVLSATGGEDAPPSSSAELWSRLQALGVDGLGRRSPPDSE